MKRVKGDLKLVRFTKKNKDKSSEFTKGYHKKGVKKSEFQFQILDHVIS